MPQPTASQSPAVIITGAGSGIGRATALLLAEAGHTCLLVGRTETSLIETAAMIDAETPGATTVIHRADLTDEQAIPGIIDAADAHFGRIDAIANIAGDAPLGPIARLATDDYRRCMAVNLDAIVFLTRAAWPVFKRQHHGIIVNVSSMASVDPFTGFSIYGAAKAAVNLFTKATADEGTRIDLKAVAIAPGAVETPMLRKNFSEKILPTDQTLDPAEIAAVIRDCITGAHPYDNGGLILLPSH